MNDHNNKIDEFCSHLPKIELHAHINGSCSEETILKLLDKKKGNPRWPDLCKLKVGANDGTFDGCFSTFGLIHELCDNEDAAYTITKDVIHEFARDNVKYLELRTTPRDVSSTGMTKSSYIESVLKAIRDVSSSDDDDIIVKLLLSIDRGKTYADAMETLKLIEIYSIQSDPVVVGLDFSGNPNVGRIETFLPVLEEARKKSVKMSLHVAEVFSSLPEVESFLNLSPDRLGHATFLRADYMSTRTDLVDKVISDKIPIELCLTSNVKTGTVKEYGKHQFEYWYGQNHPIILCTDDKGVFSTSLSMEYYLAATTFDLSLGNLMTLSYNGIDYIFSDGDVKTFLKDKWRKFEAKYPFHL